MLVIILYSLVALLALYLIGRYIPPLGFAIAFVCALVGKPFVMFEQGFKKGHDWCHAVYKNAIEGIVKKIQDHSSVGRVILSRIVWVLLAVLLLLGETFNSLVAVPPLLRIPYINLPDWLVFTSAALFLLIPVAFGAIFLEMVHAIPLNERLFPPLHWVPSRILCKDFQ